MVDLKKGDASETQQQWNRQGMMTDTSTILKNEKGDSEDQGMMPSQQQHIQKDQNYQYANLNNAPRDKSANQEFKTI